MENEFLIKQMMIVVTKIVTKLINPDFVFSPGGANIRTMQKALGGLKKKYGTLTRERIVDYCVCSAFAFKERGASWKISQMFGPKSLQRFDSNKGRKYYEDRWLNSENITRADLISLMANKSKHPLAKYIYMPMEEGTKSRLLNLEAGFAVCQISTLGWSPESESCSNCKFVEACKAETERKYPEIYRLRNEYELEK